MSWHSINLNSLHSFANVKDELSVTQDGVMLRDSRIVIPSLLQQKVIDLAHVGHQGIIKMKALLSKKVC